MKIKSEVEIHRTVEVIIDDSCFTKESLDEFEEYIFKLDTCDTRESSLISYVVVAIAQYDGISFIEGVGKAQWVSSLYEVEHRAVGSDVLVWYYTSDDYTESDIR